MSAKTDDEEYEGVLTPEELMKIQKIYDREKKYNRDQDKYAFYEGERGEWEGKWIDEMLQKLEDRRQDIARRAPLKEMFEREKKSVDATTQSRVLRKLLAALSEYNKQDRRGHFFDGNEVKTFNPCGTRSCKKRAFHIREALTFLTMVPPEVLANMTTFDSFKRGVASSMGWASTRRKTTDPSAAQNFQEAEKQYSSSWYNRATGFHDTSTGNDELDKLWRKEKIKGTNEEVYKKLKGSNEGKYYWSPDENNANLAKYPETGEWLENPKLQQRVPLQPTSSAAPLDEKERIVAYNDPVIGQEIDEPLESVVAEARYVDEDENTYDPQFQASASPLPVKESDTEHRRQNSAPQQESVQQGNPIEQTGQNPQISDKVFVIDPNLVAQGWVKKLDEKTKKTFYFNTNTGKSVWQSKDIPKPPPEPSVLFNPNNLQRMFDFTRDQYYGKTNPNMGGTLRKKKRKHRTRRVK